jgi:hypothetical protein
MNTLRGIPELVAHLNDMMLVEGKHRERERERERES